MSALDSYEWVCPNVYGMGQMSRMRLFATKALTTALRAQVHPRNGDFKTRPWCEIGMASTALHSTTTATFSVPTPPLDDGEPARQEASRAPSGLSAASLNFLARATVCLIFPTLPG